MMELAITVLALYAFVVILTKTYGYLRNKKMLKLMAQTVAIRVNEVALSTEEIEHFNKSDHLGAKIEYDVSYEHPLAEGKTIYTVTEMMFVKENSLVERTTIPTVGEFQILADPKNPHKIDVGVEFKIRGLGSKYAEKNQQLLKKFEK